MQSHRHLKYACIEYFKTKMKSNKYASKNMFVPISDLRWPLLPESNSYTNPSQSMAKHLLWTRVYQTEKIIRAKHQHRNTGQIFQLKNPITKLNLYTILIAPTTYALCFTTINSKELKQIPKYMIDHLM